MKIKISIVAVLLTFIITRTGIVSAQEEHEYVDLGLPSGTLWATCNIGASLPSDCGEYFSWGEISTKPDFDASTYSYVSSNEKPTKYCNDASFGNDGFVDNLITLEPSDDVATSQWGSGWCMPTKQQWDELRTHCKWMRTVRDGKKGSEVKGPNGNTIFLPATGKRDAWNKAPGHVGEIGYYWTSSLYTDNPQNAWYLYFGSGSAGISSNYRYFGLAIRAVKSKN